MFIVPGALASLVSLVCFVYVLIGMFKEKGVVHGLIGLLCCQLYVFIWGWIGWSDQNKTTIMIVWTIALVLGGAFNALYVNSNGGFSQFPPPTSP